MNYSSLTLHLVEDSASFCGTPNVLCLIPMSHQLSAMTCVSIDHPLKYPISIS
jgi:hypothetical protein